MVVVITASHIVIPREPTPSDPLELSPIDKKQRYHISSIFVYKHEKQNGTFGISIDKIKQSLSHMLVYYYPLAGRLSRIQDDELQFDCNAKGALLIEAKSELKSIDYGDFAPSKLVDDLVPNVDYSTPIETWPLLLVQLTKLSCGDICIGITISHSLMDAWSVHFFMNSWAKLLRTGEMLNSNEIPIYDRAILKSKFPVRSLYHDEFSAPPLLLGNTDAKQEKQNETTRMLLHLTKIQVETLKEKANQAEFDRTRKDHKIRLYSSYEVIASHIWRSACKARDLKANQPTLVRMAVSIRNRLNPPIPDNYVGNAVMLTRLQICTSGDVISKPLCYSAQKMREAIDRVDEERIRSAIDLLSGSERDSSHMPRTGSGNEHFYGNPNLAINGVNNFPLYDADFGWGKPFYVGLASLRNDGKTFILPTIHGDGSVNILMCLQTRHVELFKMFFFEEVEQESSNSSTK